MQTTENCEKIELMINYGLYFIGTPYKWGGDDPILGYDCSGFVQELLSAVGWGSTDDLTAQGIFHFLSNQNWSEKLERGCLLFFGKSRERISHIAIAISYDYMLEAGGGDQTTVNREEAAKRNAFVKIRPIKHRKDLVAYLYPV